MGFPPTHRLFLVNKAKNTSLRYSGSFVPRIGDIFRFGPLTMAVVDVVVAVAKSRDEAVQHSVWVYLEASDKAYGDPESQKYDVDEFITEAH